MDVLKEGENDSFYAVDYLAGITVTPILSSFFVKNGEITNVILFFFVQVYMLMSTY